VSRSWLLYLDDLIESAEKIGRLVSGRKAETIRWEVATTHVPKLLERAHRLRDEIDDANSASPA